jgi:type IV pilus assembly protein PilB
MTTAATDHLVQLAVATGVELAGDCLDQPAGRRLVLERIAARLGMDSVALTAVSVPADLSRIVSRAQVVRYRLLPLARTEAGLRVAVADPLDCDGLDGLSHQLGLSLEPVLADARELAEAIERCYGRGSAVADELAAADAPAVFHDNVLPADTDDDAPIIRLVHQVITEAVQRRASDIHFEPLERRLRVRYRVDGVLQEADPLPKRLQLPVVSRLKIMAGISIAEKRLPQDGRIQIVVAERPLDLRVSSLPTAHGESVVMRILDKEGLKLGLPELGFWPDDQAAFERQIGLPDGILLVTGPTGSGKTTTLYGCLHHINLPDRKIVTVEDPVEYQLTGINQVPVRPEVGMTFAAALRAMLRQAPNIVMIGEIRDAETADIAINASLTGHMVFSTLHTNDAPGAVTRLIDIGVKPFLVSTALRAVLAQRLVRKVCPACSRPYRPTRDELRLLQLDPAIAGQAEFRRGAGCEACHGTGYRGRLGIFELLVVSDALRAMIHAGAGATRLRAQARQEGMRTLREDGVRKIIAGLTTVEEVVSLTVGDAV